MPSANKTEVLKLHQWKANEFVDFLDIAEDNAKVDAAFKDLKENSFNEQGAEELLDRKIEDLRLDHRFEEKIPKTDIVNNLTSGGNTKVLSAEQGKVLASQLMDFDLLENQAGITKQTTFQSNGSILETLKKTSGNVKVADRETVFLSDGRIRETVKFYNSAGTAVIKTVTKTTIFRPDGSILEE